MPLDALSVQDKLTLMAEKAERTRERPLQVRLTEQEMRLFRRAADASGLSLSAWVRDRLRRTARAETDAVHRER